MIKDLDSNLKIKNNMIHVTDIDFTDTKVGGTGSEATGFGDVGSGPNTIGESFAFTIEKDKFPDFCFTPV